MIVIAAANGQVAMECIVLCPIGYITISITVTVAVPVNNKPGLRYVIVMMLVPTGSRLLPKKVT